MSIKVKDPAAAWRTVTQPWIKTDASTYRPATKVFTKVAGAWREAWPLQPGPVTNVITTTTYRNDRIEIDVSWTAPSTGEPVAKYIITVHAPGVYITTVVVNAPTTALTLTDAPNYNFHTIAGYGVFAQVYAQSAAGRNGDTAQSPTTTIAQLPAPPQPTSYAVTMWGCALHHTWSHSGGKRITGVEMHIYHNSNGGAATYDANTYAADYQSWNPASIGGGTVTCYLRTTGPGGVSNWVVVQGEMPNPVNTWSYRFGDGYLRAATSGISPAVQVHTVPNGGGWTHVATFGAGAGEVYDPQSVNYARDRTSWGMLLRPVNNANGWVGRDQWVGWAMKIANPYDIWPIDSATWRGWGFRSEEHVDFQGSSQAGTNAGFFFYGNQFYDHLSAAVLGYDVGISSAHIAMQRQVSGQAAAVPPILMVHRAGWAHEDINWGGEFWQTYLARNETNWVTVPADWAWYLKERWDGWKGIGVYESDRTLYQGLGYVSWNYSIYTAWNYGSIESGTRFLTTVRIYHNG